MSVKVKQRRLQLISVKNLSCLRYTRYRDRLFFWGGGSIKNNKSHVGLVPRSL